jgi:hypothetical protein
LKSTFHYSNCNLARSCLALAGGANRTNLLLWAHAIFVKKAQKRFQIPSVFALTVLEPILIGSGRKLKRFTDTAEEPTASRKILPEQIMAFSAVCVSITAGFLKMERVFAGCGE